MKRINSFKISGLHTWDFEMRHPLKLISMPRPKYGKKEDN
jgi:hypothetical protein